MYHLNNCCSGYISIFFRSQPAPNPDFPLRRRRHGSDEGRVLGGTRQVDSRDDGSQSLGKSLGQNNSHFFSLQCIWEKNALQNGHLMLLDEMLVDRERVTKYVSFQAVLDHRKVGVRSLKNDKKCTIGRFPVCISSHVYVDPSVWLINRKLGAKHWVFHGELLSGTKSSTILHRKGMNESHGPQVITPLFYIWMFPKIVVPQNGWFIMENLIKMDDLGVSLFLETPVYYNVEDA